MTDRVRSRGSRFQCPYTTEWVSHQVRWHYSGSEWVKEFRDITYTNDENEYFDDRETMSDIVGCMGSFNPVVHTRRYGSALDSVEAIYKPVVPSWFPSANEVWITYGTTMRGFQAAAISACGFSSTGTLPVPAGFPAIDWASLTYQVGSQLDGRMTTGQNLLVSLMQIAQTVSMFKNPMGLRSLPRELRKLSLRNLTKMGASRYLEYKFGWENVYRDFVQLRDVWSEVRTHQTHLRETVNKFTSLAARQTDVINNPYVPLGTLGSYLYAQVTPKITSCERIASFSLDLRRTQQALAWSKIDQVMSRLGVRDVVEALWDCVPYSFVVDWFTHVNRMLRQRSIDWHSYDIRRMGYSLKYRWLASFQYESHAYGYPANTHVTRITDSSLVQTQYQRTTGFPPACSSVGLFGNLNKTQIAEGLALIVQRI